MLAEGRQGGRQGARRLRMRAREEVSYILRRTNNLLKGVLTWSASVKRRMRILTRKWNGVW